MSLKRQNNLLFLKIVKIKKIKNRDSNVDYTNFKK